MALDEYRKKRDFTRSPEPSGDDQIVSARRSVPAARYFCVQKHLATQLHYDLRLEHQGVLLSWAVPKGPSLDPTIKRLAMHVEDHPVEYGDFEGVIPEGYGAGVVMLWDYGTWEPESPDVDTALAKGDLKLRLEGFKLKGSWALVRTRGWGSRRNAAEDGRSWLLIKHRDDWSGPLDITTFAPLSVKSELDFPEILSQQAPRVWDANPKGARAPSAAESLRDIVARVEKYQAERDAHAPARLAAPAIDATPATAAAPATDTASAVATPPPAKRRSAAAPRATAAMSSDDARPSRPRRPAAGHVTTPPETTTARPSRAKRSP